MRSAKFKFWDKKYKRFSKPFTLFEALEMSSHGFGGWKNGEFIQFTGLCDKNREEIYEGYVVSWNNRRWEVKWNKYWGAWFLNDALILGTTRLPEVIGNKWENPELLKETT